MPISPVVGLHFNNEVNGEILTLGAFAKLYCSNCNVSSHRQPHLRGSDINSSRWHTKKAFI